MHITPSWVSTHIRAYVAARLFGVCWKRVYSGVPLKVLNRRATGFDTLAKNWKGPLGLAPLGGSRGVLPRKILKFYSCRDVFSCILKLQKMCFNHQIKITFVDNLVMIWYQYPPHKLVHNLIESFQMVFYGVQFFSKRIMGRFLFLACSKRGHFMPPVIKWKFDGIVPFTFEKTSSRKGHDCIVYFKLFLIVPCIKKKFLLRS